MAKVKYLFHNINLLNAMLIIIALLFMNYTILPLLHSGFHYSLPSVRKTEDIRQEGTDSNRAVRFPSPADYINISENSLFHPERKIPVEKKEGPEAAPLPKPDFVVYGTLITDDIRLAYLEDLKAPRNTKGRGKRQTALKQGDTISGFTIKEIDADKIILQRGEEKITVNVHARERQKAVAATTPPASKPAPYQPRARSARQQESSRSQSQSAVRPQRPQAPKQQPPQAPQGAVQPPRGPFEQTVFDFFDKNKKNP